MRWVIVIALLAVTGGYAGMRWYFEYRSNWGVVVSGKLYRSSEIAPLLFTSKLEKNNIGTIIYLSRDDDGNNDMANERRVAAEHHVPILDFPMSGDGLAKPGMYPSAIAAMVDATTHGKPVLVHCHSGAQRTGGVVAVYRVLVEGKSTQEAVAEMLRYGHDPKKNPLLLPFLNDNISQWADELFHRGIISKVPSPLPRFVAP